MSPADPYGRRQPPAGKLDDASPSSRCDQMWNGFVMSDRATTLEVCRARNSCNITDIKVDGPAPPVLVGHDEIVVDAKSGNLSPKLRKRLPTKRHCLRFFDSTQRALQVTH